jgi:hypothetical protein
MTTASTPPQHVRFETTDYDRATEFLTKIYGTTIRVTGRRVGYAFRFTQMTTPTFSIGTGAQTDTLSLDVAPPASLYLFRPKGTVADYRSTQTEDRIGPGELYIASAGRNGTPYVIEWTGGAVEAAALPFPLLDKVAAIDEDVPVRFTDLRPHSREAARHLAATVDHLTDALRERPEVMAQPLVASASGQMLCASVLAAFPNTAILEPTIEDRHDSHPRTPAQGDRVHRGQRARGDHGGRHRGGGQRHGPCPATRVSPSSRHHAHGVRTSRPAAAGPPGPTGHRPDDQGDGHRGRRPLGLLPPGTVRQVLPRGLRLLAVPDTAPRRAMTSLEQAPVRL